MGKGKDKKRKGVKRSKKTFLGTRVVDGKEYAYEMSQIDLEPLLLKKDNETILEEAERLVAGPRQQHYGPPHENFKRIAEGWSAYLGVEVTPLDVCSLMIILKLARIRTGGSYHRDSAVDACGYARLMEMLAQ